MMDPDEDLERLLCTGYYKYTNKHISLHLRGPDFSHLNKDDIKDKGTEWTLE